MAQQAGVGRRYFRAFVSGFFVAVPVTVTVLDRFAYVARVEGASMQVRFFSFSISVTDRIVTFLVVAEFMEFDNLSTGERCLFSSCETCLHFT